MYDTINLASSALKMSSSWTDKKGLPVGPYKLLALGAQNGISVKPWSIAQLLCVCFFFT